MSAEESGNPLRCAVGSELGSQTPQASSSPPGTGSRASAFGIVLLKHIHQEK